MWERIERQLAARGIDPQTYAQMQGKDRHDLIDDAEEDAERALRREAVLAAVADAEGIEPDRRGPDRGDSGPGDGKNDPAKLLARLRETGRDSLLRDEVRLRKAADVDRRAREADRDGAGRGPRADLDARQGRREAGEPAGAEKPGELWTPGS